MSRSYRGTDTILSCGCAAYRTKGRARCAFALALRHEFRSRETVEWEMADQHGPASRQRKEAMGRRIRAYARYTDHLQGNDEPTTTNTNEQRDQDERRAV